MDHPLAVRVIERARYLLGDAQGRIERELLLPLELRPERLAADVRDDVEQEAIGFARVDQGEDVGMVEPGGDGDLPEKPLGTERGRDLGSQHLERDGPVMLQIVGQMDRGHAAPTQLPLDAVATSQSRGETRMVGSYHGPVFRSGACSSSCSAGAPCRPSC